MPPVQDSQMEETLFALTSKLPTPPPRPASIASSRSSRRSSVASSLARQSRHFEADLNDAPPTPSLTGLYMNMHGGTSNSNSQPPLPAPLVRSGSNQERELVDPTPSTSYSMVKTSVNNSASRPVRQQQRDPPPSSLPSTTSRRKSNRDGPTIVIKASSSPESNNTSLLTPPTVERTLSQSSHQSDSSTRPVRPVRKRPPREGNHVSGHAGSLSSSLSSRTLRQAGAFVWEIIHACFLLATLVAWPLAFGALRMVTSSSSTSKQPEGHADHAQGEGEVEENGKHSSAAEPDRTFAERFKFKVCSSLLLGNSLAISSYDTSKVKRSATEEAIKTVFYDQLPESQTHERLERCPISDDNVNISDLSTRSEIVMTKSAVFLMSATVLSAALLAPFTLSLDVWLRSIVSMASVVFALISAIGVRKCEYVRFEVQCSASGSYRLSSFDEVLRTNLVSDSMDNLQRQRIKETMCERVSTLIEESKRFDIEYNRALSLIQETELVSRGYKLSYPLPPISRIEMASTSPPRARNASLPTSRITQGHSPNLPSGSRLSWDNRPPSLIGTPVQMGNGALGSGGSKSETLRLMSLRKRLSEGFEVVQKDLQGAIDQLGPLVDLTEMELLREMYELDALPASQSILPEMTSVNSSLQRGSWASRNMAPSETTRRSSTSPTVDEHPSSPGTPLNRGSVLMEGAGVERYGSLRKRSSGAWDQTVSVRPTSRLSYISDKSPVNGPINGINHNGALKRLSYSSNGSMTAVGSLSYRSSLQPAPRIVSQNRRQSGMFVNVPTNAAPAVEEERPMSPEQSGTMTPIASNYITSESEALKIAALKKSFEAVHNVRRKVLVHLLALDFSLQPRITIESSSITSSAQYWHTIGKILTKLSSSFGSHAHFVKQDVQHEVDVRAKSAIDADESDKPKGAASDNTDYSGFEDRLIAMGQALRTVQIKMQLCASDLRKRAPPALHGEDADDTSNATTIDAKASMAVAEENTNKQNNPEVMFSTIREDLITLSAEWESALKIMRVNNLAQTASNGANKTAEVGNQQTKSTFDSPQEADEDAMREWVKRHAGLGGGAGDISTDTDIDTDIKHMIERGQMPWSEGTQSGVNKANYVSHTNGPDESSDSDKKVQEDLSTLLVRSADPAHLPAPGVEKVYEDVAVPHARLNRRSGLSRDERIKLVRESRVDADMAKRISSMDVQNGMLVELQSVITNRRSMLSNAEGASDTGEQNSVAKAAASLSASRPVLGTVNSNVDVRGRPSIEGRDAKIASQDAPGFRSSRASISRNPVRGSLSYRGRLSSPLELTNETESALPYAR